MKPLDLSGKRFGRLIVGTRKDSNRRGRTVWEVACDCGNVKNISGENLVRGKTSSCGCIQKESSARNGKLGTIKDRVKAGVNNLFAIYRYGAKVREVDWGLTVEEFESFLFCDCFYCGLEPSNTQREKSGDVSFRYSGLDRVNNRVGYFAENIVSCCSMCNKGKSVHSSKEFLEWIARVQLHQEKMNG